MTAVAVFTGLGDLTIHLVADSLLSSVEKTVSSTQISKKPILTKRFSSGLVLDESDQKEYEFFESALKLGQIQDNLAIGYSGNNVAGNEILRILKSQSPFLSFLNFQKFLMDRAIPSVTPCEGDLGLCGFMIVDRKGIKFYADSKGSFEASEDPSTIFTSGSGGPIISSLLSRIIPDEHPFDAGSAFTYITHEFYLNEFLGHKKNIIESKSGGAISGLYAENGKLFWQKSHTFIMFANIGKTGIEAKWQRYPLIYKTWHEKGSLFVTSQAEREDGNGYDQSITQLSNSLSSQLPFDAQNLLPEMRTWEADILTMFLLPLGSVHRSGIANFSKISQREEAKFFEEISEEGRLKKYRVSPKVLKKFGEMVKVKPNYGLDLYVTNDENWEVLGSPSFLHQGFFIDFDTGREKRKFFCVEGSFYIKHEEIEFPHPVHYFHMVGVLLPEGGEISDNPTIRGLHIPSDWITNVEPGPYIKSWHKPEVIPAIFCYPDSYFPTNGWSLDRIKESLLELPRCSCRERIDFLNRPQSTASPKSMPHIP